MKTFICLCMVTLVFGFFSCKEESNAPIPEVTLKEFYVVGNAQKGPFINGSNVNIYELNSNFNPTGRTFHTTTDAKGHFELKGVELVSPYVEMVADGFYFNE
ncbi:MAG TPA: hypothetical protein VFG54_13210, partial [Prolixibacteraceae bacterium]|nr:hypothetical protein [Prolixibacteraceae bacterium]